MVSVLTTLCGFLRLKTKTTVTTISRRTMRELATPEKNSNVFRGDTYKYKVIFEYVDI